MENIVFFWKDMTSCLSAAERARKTEQGFPGELNFASALVCFAFLDLLWTLYSDQVDFEDAKNGRTMPIPNPSAKLIAKFLKRAERYDKRFLNEEFGEKFYRVFRHGLVHTWLPKNAGIETKDEPFAVFAPVVEKGNKNEGVLVVPRFFRLLLAMYSDLENERAVPNSDLSRTYPERVRLIGEVYSTEGGELKEML